MLDSSTWGGRGGPLAELLSLQEAGGAWAQSSRGRPALAWPWTRGQLVFLAASVHVRQLLEAGPPVVQVVVVLVPGAGRAQRADRACSGAAPLVVEDQQGVVGGSRGVVVSCAKSLGSQRLGLGCSLCCLHSGHHKRSGREGLRRFSDFAYSRHSMRAFT